MKFYTKCFGIDSGEKKIKVLSVSVESLMRNFVEGSRNYFIYLKRNLIKNFFFKSMLEIFSSF